MADGTVIDSLVVSLGLDAKGLKEGQKEASESLRKFGQESNKTNKSMVFEAKKGVEVYKMMRNEILGLIGAFMGVSSVKQFVSEITKGDSAMGRFARNVGSTTEELSIWEGVSKRVNGNAQGIREGFKGLAQSLENINLTGQFSDSLLYFQKLDIALMDGQGHARSYTDVMMDLSKKLKGMRATQAAALTAGMNLDDNMLNILIQGPDVLTKYLAEQKVITQSSSKLAQDRQESEAKLTASLEKLGRDMVNDFSPAITKFVDGITRFIDKINELSGGHPIKTLDNKMQEWSKEHTPALYEMDKRWRERGNSGNNNSDLNKMISDKESGGNYNAINDNRVKRNLEGMSINDILREQNAGVYGAAGKYQMMKGTISDAVKALHLSGKEKFSKDMQERIQNEFILGKKRQNLYDYLHGKSDNMDAAINDMQKEFEVTGNGAIPRSQLIRALQNTREQNMSSSVSNSSRVEVGQVIINTPSTDPGQHATEFSRELSIVSQANTGLD